MRALQRVYKLSTVRDRIRLERESRLTKGIDAKNLTTKAQYDLNKIRNIGIIAHIDAGKTTTTERMLYYAGALPSPGNIDEGTTTMDFLEQERKRGITIRSAAISFNWLDHQINLIDTPGHVDFSGYVTRSLRVLDGVVTIIDGVKGVEAQTQKVWAMATKHQIPKICFINKMDRIGSSAEQAISSLRERLGIIPFVLQTALGDGESFKGVYDLIEVEYVQFLGKYGELIKKNKVEKHSEKHNHLLKLRNYLVSTVADYNDEIGDMFLNYHFVPPHKLKAAIRKVLMDPLHAYKVSPIILGASFKNLGVQPLLDGVVSYLPSPADRKPIFSVEDNRNERKPYKSEPFTGYVFKVLFDADKGPLAFTRIYSGSILKNFELFNSTKKIYERVYKIYRVRANQYVSIHELNAGDIVALSGFKYTNAGDTLTQEGDYYILQNLEIPQPVFTAPFELQSTKHQREFDYAMHRSVTYDTSLSFKYYSYTNQYLVSGLGYLHLYILRDRLIGEGIPVKMGDLKINFMESINKDKYGSLQIKNYLKPTVFEEFNLSIKIVPLRNEDEQVEKKNEVIFTFEKVGEFDMLWGYFLKKKILSKNPSDKNNYSKYYLSKMKKTARNPTPLEPIYDEYEYVYTKYVIDDYQYSEDDDYKPRDKGGLEYEYYYHINTLPFETLYELVETCQTSLLYGRNKLPLIGIQLQISNGKYKKSSFSKSVMNRCASQLTRSLLDSSSVLIEPFMYFNISGEEGMIDIALREVLKKRGRVSDQTPTMICGFVPAEGVKGWVKYLRAMGLEIEFKFSYYEEVVGINPYKLLQDNI